MSSICREYEEQIEELRNPRGATEEMRRKYGGPSDAEVFAVWLDNHAPRCEVCREGVRDGRISRLEDRTMKTKKTVKEEVKVLNPSVTGNLHKPVTEEEPSRIATILQQLTASGMPMTVKMESGSSLTSATLKDESIRFSMRLQIRRKSYGRGAGYRLHVGEGSAGFLLVEGHDVTGRERPLLWLKNPMGVVAKVIEAMVAARARLDKVLVAEARDGAIAAMLAKAGLDEERDQRRVYGGDGTPESLGDYHIRIAVPMTPEGLAAVKRAYEVLEAVGGKRW